MAFRVLVPAGPTVSSSPSRLKVKMARVISWAILVYPQYLNPFLETDVYVLREWKWYSGCRISKADCMTAFW
jgi:hypothetical protein